MIHMEPDRMAWINRVIESWRETGRDGGTILASVAATIADDLVGEVDRLRGAIAEHAAQKADDRCWMDDLGLYSTAGVSHTADNSVGDKDAMLANCRRFIERRCAGGRWKSYVELEAERDKLQAFKDWVHRYLDTHGVPHHPPGPHGTEGCRIGDRMDWLMAERERLAGLVATMQMAAIVLDAKENRP